MKKVAGFRWKDQRISSRKGAKNAKVTLGTKTLTTWKNLLMEFF
jgi:hypothetical protein